MLAAALDRLSPPCGGAATGLLESLAGPMDPEALEASEVMARYCRGDAAAFERLYALLAPRILAYLRGLLGDLWCRNIC